MGNDFTPLQNAFLVWETVFHPCKMLSRLGKRFFTLVKCFPNLSRKSQCRSDLRNNLFLHYVHGTKVSTTRYVDQQHHGQFALFFEHLYIRAHIAGGHVPVDIADIVALTIANRKHDVVAIQVYDRRETELPSVGLMKIKDAETGAERWIDSSSARVREAYKEWWNRRQTIMSDSFKKCRVDSVSIRTEDDYVKALIALFDKRS